MGKIVSTNSEQLPPWLLPLLQTAKPAPATLIIGNPAVGADILALALAEEIAQTKNATNHPDILVARPQPPKKNKKGPDDDIPAATEVPAGTDEKTLKIRVTHAREIGGFCALMPMMLQFRVVVVLSAEKMNPNAANALLKILEEPGETKRFILRARSAQLLPPTIVSRCQTLSVPAPSPAEAEEWLREKGEKAKAETLAYCGGNILRAREAAENESAREAILKELNAGKKMNVHSAALACAKTGEWLECLQKWASDGARASSGIVPRYFPKCENELRAQNAPPEKWLNLHATLVKHRRWIDHPLQNDLRIREALCACKNVFAD